MSLLITNVPQRRQYLFAVLTQKVNYTSAIHPVTSNYNAGIEHRIQFWCCECETVCETMIRARLWPASPRFPETAFTFELLDWAESLLLECQVALGDFCRSLYFNCPHLVNKVCGMIWCDTFITLFLFLLEKRHLCFNDRRFWRIQVLFINSYTVKNEVRWLHFFHFTVYIIMPYR